MSRGRNCPRVVADWTCFDRLVNLYIYHHPANRAYRVIGMNAQQQAVINSSLFPDVKYSHSNDVFHTWTDAQYVLIVSLSRVRLLFAQIRVRHSLCVGSAGQEVFGRLCAVRECAER